RGSAAAPRPGRRLLPARQIAATTLVIADATAGEQWLYMDPGRFYEINSAACMHLIYETLYHAPDSSRPDQFEPLLAAEPPTVSADGREATISLRPGVRFHNSGNEMTADDWVFSWNRLANVNGNGAFLATSYWNNVEAVDPLTLRLTFDRSVAPLQAILSSLPLAVTDSKAMREQGASDAPGADEADLPAQEWLDGGNSAGTGPFRLTVWDRTSEVVLERHQEYWGTPSALERVIFRNIADANSQLQAVETGEADIAYSVDPDAAAGVEANPDLQIITGPTLAIEYLALHTSEEVGGPLANPQLRQAIGYAVDYEGIVNDLMAGGAENPGPATIVPLPLLGSREAQQFAYRTDLARAQELFDASGVGPVELTFSFGSGGDTGVGGLNLETLATKLQADLQRINGLIITLNPMDPETRITEYRAGNLQFTVSPWTPDFPDVDSYAVPFAHSGNTGTAARRVGYGTPELDQILDAGLFELDPTRRAQLYLDVQRRLTEDAPFLVLYQPLDRKPARATVRGVATHSIYQLQLRNASKTG
ncbi:MAG: ABC transporter substrate-binding protein, partial [Chloroflexota bacterium]|nr:ABC transporter substrate-binding protein [Chloroflexota bacterium]